MYPGSGWSKSDSLTGFKAMILELAGFIFLSCLALLMIFNFFIKPKETAKDAAIKAGEVRGILGWDRFQEIVSEYYERFTSDECTWQEFANFVRAVKLLHRSIGDPDGPVSGSETLDEMLNKMRDSAVWPWFEYLLSERASSVLKKLTGFLEDLQVQMTDDQRTDLEKLKKAIEKLHASTEWYRAG